MQTTPSLPTGSKILVVDDDSVFYRSINLGLRKKGWTCVWCLDAHSALEAAQNYQPDVVMMDVHLPDGDGMTLVRQLREQGYPGRVLVVTGDANAAAKARLDSRSADVDEVVLEKPFSMRALHGYLRQLTRH